jgi:hypothetical protein
MSKQKLTILDVASRSGIAKRTGNPWQIWEAQCALESEDAQKGRTIIVGTINLPDSLKDAQPGDYLAEFSFFRSMEGKLEPRVVSLVPFGSPRAAPKSGQGVAT